MTRLFLVAAVVALTLSLAAPVEAIHQVDHRYVVLGHVRDATGRPLARTIVGVLREKTGLVYDTETDADGFYLVIVHLHDEDLLQTLRVATGRTMVRVEARFNPFDSRTPRGTRVDFTDGVARERPEDFATALERYVRK